jgi:phosphoserine phosphatase
VKQRAALFDMDKTLIAKHSSELYVRFQRDIGEASWRDSLRLSTWLLQYSLGLLDATGVAQRIIGGYRGQAEADLIAKCERWYPDYVRPHLSSAGAAVVRACQAAGDFTAIVTASTRYASAPLARELGIEGIVATEVEVDGAGMLTGGVVWPLCYAEGKVRGGGRAARRQSGPAPPARGRATRLADLGLVKQASTKHQRPGLRRGVGAAALSVDRLISARRRYPRPGPRRNRRGTDRPWRRPRR